MGLGMQDCEISISLKEKEQDDFISQKLPTNSLLLDGINDKHLIYMLEVNL